MTQTEWIISLDDDLKDYDELFVGNVRDGDRLIRCKDCKYYRADGDCWHEWDNDGRVYYQSIINEPNPDDYCSRAERRTDDLEADKRI